jgi:phage terminase Nu1 subunit (DNA packaging protein)
LRQIELEDTGVARELSEDGRPQGYPTEAFGRWLRARWAAEFGVSSSGEVYDEKLERARLLHHQANREAMKEAEDRGEYVPAGIVAEFGAATVNATKTRILAIASKLRGRFPDVPQSMIDALDDLHREALQELGEDGLHAELRRRLSKHVG